jgi:hypothetical protein
MIFQIVIDARNLIQQRGRSITFEGNQGEHLKREKEEGEGEGGRKQREEMRKERKNEKTNRQGRRISKNKSRKHSNPIHMEKVNAGNYAPTRTTSATTIRKKNESRKRNHRAKPITEETKEREKKRKKETGANKQRGGEEESEDKYLGGPVVFDFVEIRFNIPFRERGGDNGIDLLFVFV